MKNKVKIISILSLMMFSFFYTEKIASYVQNKTPLKKQILTYKENNNISPIDAKIEKENVIPGINGKSVDVNKSYNEMKYQNKFNESSIVYKEEPPDVSIDDYPNIIITRGNPEKKSTSIIITKHNQNLNYLKEKNINFDFIDKIKYCLITSFSNCNNTSKQKVKASYELTNTNFIKYIKYVDKGSIIYLSDDLDVLYIDILLKHLKFYNIKVLNLETHLSESMKY